MHFDVVPDGGVVGVDLIGGSVALRRHVTAFHNIRPGAATGALYLLDGRSLRAAGGPGAFRVRSMRVRVAGEYDYIRAWRVAPETGSFPWIRVSRPSY